MLGKDHKELEGEDGLDEPVERLDVSSAIEDEIDSVFAEDLEVDDQSWDHIFEDDKKVIDTLDVDNLFDERRRDLHDNLRDEVDKALSQPTMSNASLFRIKSSQATDLTREEEISTLKDIEEIWDESEDPEDTKRNRKSIFLMYLLIALFSIAGAWALWLSLNDKRGNDVELLAQEKAAKNAELNRLKHRQQIKDISELVSQYVYAQTVDEKYESIYRADTLRDSIVSYYDKNNLLQNVSQLELDSTVIPMQIGGEKVWEVIKRFRREGKEVLKPYYIRRDSDQNYKVDWKADVAYQENDVLEFQKSRSKKSTSFRFNVKPLTKLVTYNWGFKDSDYDVYWLGVPNTDMVFWGYVKKDSKAQNDLSSYLSQDVINRVWNEQSEHQYILKVRFLEDSPHENDQYILIEDVVSRKWVNIAE